MFGIYSSILVVSSQRPSQGRPAGGGASDGYGLGRGAAGPARRSTTSAAGALRVTVRTNPSNTSDLAPPLVPFTEPVDWRT